MHPWDKARWVMGVLWLCVVSAPSLAADGAGVALDARSRFAEAYRTAALVNPEAAERSLANQITAHPLDPGLRLAHAEILALAGRSDEAQRELGEAQRLALRGQGLPANWVKSVQVAIADGADAASMTPEVCASRLATIPESDFPFLHRVLQSLPPILKRLAIRGYLQGLVRAQNQASGSSNPVWTPAAPEFQEAAKIALARWDQVEAQDNVGPYLDIDRIGAAVKLCESYPPVARVQLVRLLTDPALLPVHQRLDALMVAAAASSPISLQSPELVALGLEARRAFLQFPSDRTYAQLDTCDEPSFGSVCTLSKSVGYTSDPRWAEVGKALALDPKSHERAALMGASLRQDVDQYNALYQRFVDRVATRSDPIPAPAATPAPTRVPNADAGSAPVPVPTPDAAAAASDSDTPHDDSGKSWNRLSDGSFLRVDVVPAADQHVSYVTAYQAPYFNKGTWTVEKYDADCHSNRYTLLEHANVGSQNLPTGFRVSNPTTYEARPGYRVWESLRAACTRAYGDVVPDNAAR